MPKQLKGRAALVDEHDAAWHAEYKRRDESVEEYLSAPPLPEWSAPAHVTRELFGRFLLDRDANVLHDVSAATVACGVDGVRNGTFFHFLSETHDHASDATDCPHCIGG